MSNEFDTLPSTPNSTTSSNEDEKKHKAFVSVFDIKDFISPKLYGELSWDENRTADEVTQDCIDRACVLAETLLHLVDQNLNLFSDTQKEIVKTLTVYELYIYNGDRYKAKAFMEKAERLISNRYGSLESKRDEGVPVGSIRVPD